MYTPSEWRQHVKNIINKKVSRKDGRDILVPNSDDKSGFGIVVPEPIAGLAKISLDDVIGPGVGGLGAFVGTILARKYGSKLSEVISSNASIFGAVAGVLASLPLYWVRGSSAVISGAVTSVIVGAGLFALEKAQLLTLTGIRMEPLGLISAQPVGALPAARISDAGNLPRRVGQQIDAGAWGRPIG